MRTGLAFSISCLLASLGFAQQSPPSVYAPPEIPTEESGTNLGAVHFDLSVAYATDYVYRGVEVFEVPSSEDTLNLQLSTKLQFDLGKLPHPYVEVFVNVAENDPVSDFQEIRPTVGFDWTIKPIVISGGHISCIYPDRDHFETGEVFLKVGLDENVLFGGKPVPAPYVLAAYDYDLYDGVYLEAGAKYRVPFDEIGLNLTFTGDVGYVSGYNASISGPGGTILPGFFTTPLTSDASITGLQHWQVGLIGEYSLNKLFNVSNRYGDWSLTGYLFYTDTFDDEIGATNQVWGGAGISFSY